MAEQANTNNQQGKQGTGYKVSVDRPGGNVIKGNSYPVSVDTKPPVAAKPVSAPPKSAPKNSNK